MSIQVSKKPLYWHFLRKFGENIGRLAGRATEWIESNLQLGARKIVIYVYSSHTVILPD